MEAYNPKLLAYGSSSAKGTNLALLSASFYLLSIAFCFTLNSYKSSTLISVERWNLGLGEQRVDRIDLFDTLGILPRLSERPLHYFLLIIVRENSLAYVLVPSN